MKKAFNMIELVFVIVILGILASIAVPRLITNKEDAQIVRAKTVISSVRSYIVIEHNNRILSGVGGYPPSLQSTDKPKEPFSAALSQKPIDWTIGSGAGNNFYDVRIKKDMSGYCQYEYDPNTGYFGINRKLGANMKYYTLCNKLDYEN